MKPVIYSPITDAADVDFSAYPRPQMVRDSYFCLNGEWSFTTSKSALPPESYPLKIRVPFPVESSLSGITKTPEKGEFLHYKRTFALPAYFVKDRVLLHFGASDQITTVYLNGKRIGTNEGGYHPFSFDITEELRNENELIVSVLDNLCKKYPYGKQKKKRGGMWYTPVSGIWQTVWLESVADKYITALKISQTMTSVTVQVFGGEDEKTLTLKETGESYRFNGTTITVTPAAPKLWSPENPYLYEFTLSAGQDMVESYFALREISVQAVHDIPRICLNGKPYFIQALLDQGYYPDGLFLPKTPTVYESDILKAKQMGYNTLRKHIKIEPLIFYNLCDKLGMIVFQDMVNNGRYSFLRDTALPTVGILKRNDKKMHRNKESRMQFEIEMRKTLDHLHNTPSVLLYTIFNEGWGQFCADDMLEIAKQTDPTRIYDATSGWFWQKNSDLDSLHVYFKPLKTRAASDRPFLISEFGGYSLRINGHTASEKNYGYKSFADKNALTDALRALYTEQALPLVPMGLCGLVYTQIADVEDETNGLLTYDRTVEKVNASEIKEMLSRFDAVYRELFEKD